MMFVILVITTYFIGSTMTMPLSELIPTDFARGVMLYVSLGTYPGYE